MLSKLIPVGNIKGGVGKSTTAINLACALAKQDFKVAVVDADDQGSAADWCAARRLPIAVDSIHWGDGRGARDNWVAAILAAKAAVDLLFLDLPPNAPEMLAAALAVADLFVIPVTASSADLKATAMALQLLEEAREARNEEKPDCLVVPSRVDRRTSSGRDIEAILREFGQPLSPPIGQRSAHVGAFSAGQWVGQFAPRSLAHKEVDALAAVVRQKLA